MCETWRRDLAIPGIREAVERCRGRRIAVVPLVGGACLKGPTLKMMAAQGFAPDLGGVASFYRGLIEEFWIDPHDLFWKELLERTDVKVCLADLILNTRKQKAALGRQLIARG